MEISNSAPAPVRAFMLLCGMMATQIVIALIKSRVFEAMGKEQKTAAEIASECSLNENVLSRTLRYAAQLDLVTKNGNSYSLTDIGRCFLKDTPGSFSTSAPFLTAPPWRDSWQNFSYSLQTGKPAFDQVWGTSFFEFLETNEEYGKPFNQMGTERSTMMAPTAVEAYDFSAFNTICDVGGGQGMLLKVILENNPQAKGILFDLQNTVKNHVLGSLDNRFEVISGSFFEHVPNADCIILKAIIHDWSDENSEKILSNCRRALNPEGKLLLIEFVVEEPYNPMLLFADLHMQVMIGGAERTELEFRDLLQSAGFALNRIIPTKSGMVIIEAV
ncbi:MAG: methyltransferase domain-containing protein [Saprospirales bacterium]|nr:methyltransferase domain-containing protein [Saprospirales bacterium]